MKKYLYVTDDALSKKLSGEGVIFCGSLKDINGKTITVFSCDERSVDKYKEFTDKIAIKNELFVTLDRK